MLLEKQGGSGNITLYLGIPLSVFTTASQPTYLYTPDAGGMIQSRVHLAHFLGVPHIPDINAVVVVYTRQPLIGGIKGQGNGVWIPGIGCSREEATVGKKVSKLVNAELIKWRTERSENRN